MIIRHRRTTYVFHLLNKPHFRFAHSKMMQPYGVILCRDTLYLSQQYLVMWGKPQELLQGMIKMVTKIIDDAKWQERKENVLAWCVANPELAKEENREISVNTFFSLGEQQAEMRGIYWTSIGSLFKGLPTSPIGGGRSSRMSIGQKSQLDVYHNSIKDNLKSDYMASDTLQAIERTHGKSGGNLYSTMFDTIEEGATAWAHDKSKKVRAYLSAAFNAAYDNDETAKVSWPTVLSDDGERQVLDFNEEGIPNLTYRSVSVGEEEE